MYITKDPKIALIAEDAGVDRIFLDMEYIGKQSRQNGRKSVLNHHTPEDVAAVRKVIHRSDVLVRVNAIHDASAYYGPSEEEIEEVIKAGADVVMLPYFKTKEEVERFLNIVDGRARTQLLLETPEAADLVDEILKIKGIDEVHLGINDLCIGYGKKFMFEMLTDGTVERLCEKCRSAGIPYGFGGIASPGKGLLPAEYVLKEHYRLGSSGVILSRSFCDVHIRTSYEEIRDIFTTGVAGIRALEEICSRKLEQGDMAYFEKNRKELVRRVRMICGDES